MVMMGIGIVGQAPVVVGWGPSSRAAVRLHEQGLDLHDGKTRPLGVPGSRSPSTNLTPLPNPSPTTDRV
jgi:hypothetical protein